MDSSAEKFPPGLNNAFLFATFNALSFQIILGSPMILYAKNLGASATVLGIISGMLPLLVIFQIPAANYIGRVGYKKFVYAGWGSRVIFIFAIGLVPGMNFLSSGTKLSLILFLLFIFNLLRGISSCAWLPWISSLVPTSVRGRFLAADQAFIGVASCAAFLISAAMLGDQPRAWQFAALFFLSGINGVISLRFLKRIPDVPVPEEIRTSKQPVPWLAMLQHPPFKKLLIMNLGWSIAYGGISAFTVAFLKTETTMSERSILILSSVFFLGALFSLWFGRRLDKLGSKPVMIFSSILWLIILSVWLLLAGKYFAPEPFLILGLQFAMGLGASVFNMSNVRLAMVVTPEMGRNHFFALYSVVANLSLGLSPIVWGIVIDGFADLNYTTHNFEWNRFGVFFCGAAFMFIVTTYLKLKLEEPAAKPVEELVREMFISSPQRMIARVWPR
ncbi:MAG TPA: MFS transporter [Verrucomicrobiae bacterium]